MRIGEIYFHNVRSFRGEHRISFVDLLVDKEGRVMVPASWHQNGNGTPRVRGSMNNGWRLKLRSILATLPLG
jgi:hypothetical protein